MCRQHNRGAASQRTRGRDRCSAVKPLFRGLALAMLASGWAPAETLTVVSYNVENYVAADRVTEEGFRRDYPKPETQKRALRQVLGALRADVLLLQEMGDERYLRELQRDLQRAGIEYSFHAVLEAADAARHIAVLSRRPLQALTLHAQVAFPYLGGTERVKRGVLEFQIATSGGPVTLFGVHLKSRFTERPEDPQSALRRLGEATAIRDLVLARVGDPRTARFAIVGDFNDDKASPVLRRLLQRGRTRVAVLLPIADSRGDTWTYVHRKDESYTRVDHVLVSPALLPNVGEQRARIYDGEGVRDASDHRPLILTLEIPAGTVAAEPVPAP